MLCPSCSHTTVFALAFIVFFPFPICQLLSPQLSLKTFYPQFFLLLNFWQKKACFEQVDINASSAIYTQTTKCIVQLVLAQSIHDYGMTLTRASLRYRGKLMVVLKYYARLNPMHPSE